MCYLMSKFKLDYDIIRDWMFTYKQVGFQVLTVGWLWSRMLRRVVW
jgi:hypothetical protein